MRVAVLTTLVKRLTIKVHKTTQKETVFMSFHQKISSDTLSKIS